MLEAKMDHLNLPK